MPRLPEGTIETTSIGIGCAYLTDGGFSHAPERLIRRAYEAGARHFDVAPQYGLGTAEAVLGRALVGLRDQVTITTKVGIRRPAVSRSKLILRSLLLPLRSLIRPNLPVGTVPRVLDFDPEYVAASLEDSLRQLKTDRVDAFLLHMPSLSDITPALIDRLTALKASGKAKAIGLATNYEDTAEILAAWPDVFDVVQHSWSVLDPLVGMDVAEPFRITHRAVKRALGPMITWLAADQARQRRLSELINADLGDQRVLVKALIGAALAANSGGIVLVASRSAERTEENVRTALDPATPVLGAALLTSLAGEIGLPAPSA